MINWIAILHESCSLPIPGEQKKPVPRARRQAPGDDDRTPFNPNNPYHVSAIWLEKFSTWRLYLHRWIRGRWSEREIQYNWISMQKSHWISESDPCMIDSFNVTVAVLPAAILNMAVISIKCEYPFGKNVHPNCNHSDPWGQIAAQQYFRTVNSERASRYLSTSIVDHRTCYVLPIFGP